MVNPDPIKISWFVVHTINMAMNDEPIWRYCYRTWATNPRFDTLFIIGLLVAEAILGFLIIDRVPYTEIDWQAYMEEVDAYEAGERDYTKIRGGTGPLVYPAGFLYVFSALKAWTGNGTDIRTAQYIFLGFYLATQAAVLSIYQQCLRSTWRSVAEIWSWRLAMGCLCLSKRIHSIFLLRLFNDGPTMLLLYISMHLFNKNRWSVGCFIFSLAVSIKMNVLLFAPGLLLLLLQTSRHWQSVILRLGLCCGLPQLLLGAPFLLTHPVSYLRKAFELDRVFFYKWTVNWKVRFVSVSMSHTSSTLSISFYRKICLLQNLCPCSYSRFTYPSWCISLFTVFRSKASFSDGPSIQCISHKHYCSPILWEFASPERYIINSTLGTFMRYPFSCGLHSAFRWLYG